jgi:hypothetical protein
MLRPSSLDELRELCRGIGTSFEHLETRDSYGTETELPHLAAWRQGEPDDYEWLQWWLDMLRSHRAAGRTCRRARIVSEPVSDYQRWVLSYVHLFTDAGEDTRYVPRPRLKPVQLPGSGDFYIFDNKTVLFLHYSGTGTNASFELADDPGIVRTCREAFDSVWELAVPSGEYCPA